ncbi:MAG: M20/M25/M40 family metallo-hydrolase [bacterium]|nr:M20/M25/M40 family metallo-hydrolase [bacterium]
MNQTYLNLVSEFIKFKSISTDNTFATEIQKCALWLKNTFTENGFKVNIINGYGNPIVVAHYQTNPEYKTALIYGHYDVQPADKSEGWNSEPFELFNDGKRLYARGSIDNKGQVAIHIATIIDLIKENQLKYNITFMIEGNEETGSPLLGKFIQDNKVLLKADVVVISDGEITGNNPILELGFRGGFNTTITIKTATNDLHSGIYGGLAPNAAHEAAKLIAKLYDENNHITIPHFYNDVAQIENPEIIPFDQKEYQRITGAKAVLKEPEFDPYTQVGLRPSIQVTGLQSGYIGEGYKNGIHAKAILKINFRLVRNQNSAKIAEEFRDYLKETLPSYVDFNIEVNDIHQGVKIDLNNDYIHKAKAILEKAYGTKPLLKYSGGGLPIVTFFEEALGVPQVLVPLANEDCNMHGANENFNLEDIEKSLEFSKEFFKS